MLLAPRPDLRSWDQPEVRRAAVCSLLSPAAFRELGRSDNKGLGSRGLQ